MSCTSASPRCRTQALPEWVAAYDFLRIQWLPHTGSAFVTKGTRREWLLEANRSWYLKHRRTCSRVLYSLCVLLSSLTVWSNKLLTAVFYRGQ
jgi:L-gulonolactone oxidase